MNSFFESYQLNELLVILFLCLLFGMSVSFGLRILQRIFSSISSR